MQRFLISVGLTIMLGISGLGACASLNPIDAEYEALAKQNQELVPQLWFGMPEADALTALGTAQVKPPWFNERSIGPARIGNPLDRVELESELGERYDVVRYFVSVSGQGQCPFVHGRAHLKPLIFVNGKLVGWEWSYLEEVLKRRMTPEEMSWSFGEFCG